MDERNETWDLKSFVEALSAELDRAQDTLRVKSLNRPLTYSVQDVSFDLNVFAEYDGDTVYFRTARPNETGASTIKLSLGSITDRVVAETTKPPPKAGERLDDIEIPTLDEGTRRSLRRLGAETVDDVKRLAQRNIKVKTGRGEDVDFARLAAMMERANEPPRRPQVQRVGLVHSPDGARLRVMGDDMVEIMPERTRLNGRLVQASLVDSALEVILGHAVPNGDLMIETLGGEQLLLRLTE